MAILSHTNPLLPGEEASLRYNKRLLRWIKARLAPVSQTPLTDAGFHQEITKPLTLRFARAIVHMPNGLVDPKLRAVR